MSLWNVLTFLLTILKEFDELHVLPVENVLKYLKFLHEYKIHKIFEMTALIHESYLSRDSTCSCFFYPNIHPHAFRDLEVILHDILMRNQDVAI